MALIKILKDKLGRVLYPRTVTGAVYDADGVDLETRLAAERTATSEALAGKVSAAQGRGLSANDYTDAARAKLDALPTAANLAAQLGQAERAVFRDRWLATLAMFPDMPTYSDDVAATTSDGRRYGVNGLVFDYDTAQKVMAYSNTVTKTLTRLYSRYFNKQQPAEVTTFFPTLVDNYLAGCESMYNGNAAIETICLYSVQGATLSTTNARYMFSNCSKLRTIYGTLNLGDVTGVGNLDQIFANARALVEVRISKLKHSLSLSACSKISIDSINYLVTNAANTSTIVVTVHADVFAKLTGDTSNAAAAALTEEELAAWGAVLEAASAKNISFATA